MYNIKLFEALREIKLSRNLLFSILLTTITASFIFMGSKFIQPLLQIIGLDIIYFGIIYASMRVIMGIGGNLTHLLENYFKPEKLLFLGIFGIIISFLGFSLGTGIILIIAILLLKFSEGFNRIVLEDEINKNIKSNNRTTILSISALSSELFNAILIASFGLAADLIGVQEIFLYAIIFLIIITITTLILMNKKPSMKIF